jgi:hypothetical protein
MDFTFSLLLVLGYIASYNNIHSVSAGPTDHLEMRGPASIPSSLRSPKKPNTKDATRGYDLKSFTASDLQGLNGPPSRIRDPLPMGCPSAIAIPRRFATNYWRGPRYIIDLTLSGVCEEWLRHCARRLHLRLGMRGAAVRTRCAWGEVSRTEVPYEKLAVVPYDCV